MVTPQKPTQKQESLMENQVPTNSSANCQKSIEEKSQTFGNHKSESINIPTLPWYKELVHTSDDSEKLSNATLFKFLVGCLIPLIIVFGIMIYFKKAPSDDMLQWIVILSSLAGIIVLMLLKRLLSNLCQLIRPILKMIF